jgi:hypothetical protein
MELLVAQTLSRRTSTAVMFFAPLRDYLNQGSGNAFLEFSRNCDSIPDKAQHEERTIFACMSIASVELSSLIPSQYSNTK